MSDVGVRLAGLKFVLAGILAIGIGISQAIYGWVGSGMYYRILYPALCIPIGLLVLCIGLFAFLANDSPEAETEAQPKSNDKNPVAKGRDSDDSSTETPPPEKTSHTAFDPRILAVVFLLGIVAIRLAPVFFEHSQRQQKQYPSTVENFTNKVNQRGQKLHQLQARMTEAGITKVEQEQFFRSFYPLDENEAKRQGAMEILAGDWKLLQDWDFEMLNERVDELIREKQMELHGRE